MKIKAPAKVNLYLDAARPAGKNGFHSIISLTGKISLFDEIELERAAYNSISVYGDYRIPAGRENLCMKAADIMLPPSSGKGVRIKLKKYIPPGQGLGGGSSDAAAVLKGIDKLWGLKSSPARLNEAAASLGSDVPLFMRRETFCWIEGRGERVTPADMNLAGCVVVLFGRHLSTKKVYESYDAGPIHRLTARAVKKIKYGEPVFYNALEDTAASMMPALKKKEEMLLKRGALVAMMTGSGSAVFALFGGRQNCRNIEKFFNNNASCSIAEFL